MRQGDHVELKSVLEEIVRIKGVTSVALIGKDGFIVESVTAEGISIDLDFLGGVASSSVASSQALAEFFGKGDVSQAMIEFEEGPVLLTPVGEKGEQYLLLNTLASTQNLGRVRFQLKKYLSRVVEAAQA